MFGLEPIDPAAWCRIARAEKLYADAPTRGLKKLEIDPHHPVSVKKWAARLRRRARARYAGRKRPEEPTDALPGSTDKVEVMMARVAAGQECFHPGDGPAAVTGAHAGAGREGLMIRERIDNGRSYVNVSTVRQTHEGVERCASIPN